MVLAWISNPDNWMCYLVVFSYKVYVVFNEFKLETFLGSLKIWAKASA